jgi:hypothetical protein
MAKPKQRPPQKEKSLVRNLKGDALEVHILTSFDIYWMGIAA